MLHEPVRLLDDHISLHPVKNHALTHSSEAVHNITHKPYAFKFHSRVHVSITTVHHMYMM